MEAGAGVGLGVAVGVGIGVAVGVGIGVAVGGGVTVGTGVAVGVGTGTRVLVGSAVELATVVEEPDSSPQETAIAKAHKAANSPKRPSQRIIRGIHYLHPPPYTPAANYTLPAGSSLGRRVDTPQQAFP